MIPQRAPTGLDAFVQTQQTRHLQAAKWSVGRLPLPGIAQQQWLPCNRRRRSPSDSRSPVRRRSRTPVRRSRSRSRGGDPYWQVLTHCLRTPRSTAATLAYWHHSGIVTGTAGLPQWSMLSTRLKQRQTLCMLQKKAQPADR